MSSWLCGFWSNTIRDEVELEVLVSLTRYTDLANNSDKFRRIFTVHDLKGIFRPYTFTQTGRWTYLTGAGNWTGGTVRAGKVVSNAAWNRAGTSHGALHRGEVRRQMKDYQVTEADRLMLWSEAEPILRRLPHNLFVVNGASAPAPRLGLNSVSQPVDPNAGMRTPVDTHLGNRVAQLLARSMDENTDPFDLFADLAEMKNAIQEQAEAVEKMQLDWKLANETVLNRVTG